MKTLLVAIVKNENRYLDEWINYHYNIGFDQIILCDNNDTDGEIINNDKVIVENFRGYHKTGFINAVWNSGIQGDAYNFCYEKYNKDYDWIAFFDVDEFLTLDNLSLHEFLSNVDNKTKQICISSKTFGDNNHVYYENKLVQERFTKEINNIGYCDNNHNLQPFKSIIKCGLKNLKVLCHNSYLFGKTINGNFERIPNFRILHTLIPAEYDNIYIKHYETKSTEEFFNRHYQKTSATGNDVKHNNIYNLYDKYFTYNEWTQEKHDLIIKKYNINIKYTKHLSLIKRVATKILLYRYLICKKIINIYETIIGSNSKK